MSVDACLLVMNPRRIPECMDAFATLDVPKAYLTGFTERKLVPVIADVIAGTRYSHYVIVSDDVVVRQSALDAVLDLLDAHPVVTGWCNLDATDARVNLTRSPLGALSPTVEAYDFYRWQEVLGHRGATVRTYFAGMCLTGMSRELWLRYPFGVYGQPGDRGHASDFHLCWRLQRDGVPIVAARDGYVHHVKTQWNVLDRGEDRRLRIGEHVGVRFEDGGDELLPRVKAVVITD